MIRKRKLLGQRGFTLVEVMIASAIALVSILAIVTIQVHLAAESRSLSQKAEALEFARQVGEIFTDDKICECNTKGLPLVKPDPSKDVFQAEFTAPLRSMCAPDPNQNVLAKVGEDLKNTSYPLPVRRILVDKLEKLPGSVPVTIAGTTYDVYTGAISVVFGDDPASNERKMVRPLQPATVMKKFYVNSNQIQACGPASDDVIYVTSPDSVKNDLNGTTESVAECPAGTFVIGGGWFPTNKLGGGLPPGCSSAYSAVIASYPDTSNFRQWKVHILCHEYVAYAVCKRQVVPKS